MTKSSNFMQVHWPALPFFLLFLSVSGCQRAPLPSEGQQGAGACSQDPALSHLRVPGPDVQRLLAEDAQGVPEVPMGKPAVSGAAAQAPRVLAPRFASSYEVELSPHTDGTWERLENEGGDIDVWTLRIESPGSRSLNLGFSDYLMPQGGELWLRSGDCTQALGPFTDANNIKARQLYTPIIEGDALVVEVRVPSHLRHLLRLQLHAVNRGYREPGVAAAQQGGGCHVDVACNQAEEWEDEVSSVALATFSGTRSCTVFAINTTRDDSLPYVMTASHCINEENAPSVVAYWNYQKSMCGGSPDGSLTQYTTGASLAASFGETDLALVELSQRPDFGIFYAGWNVGQGAPSSAVTIHHPRQKEKSISFENDPLQITARVDDLPDPSASYLRVGDWDAGSTDPGSSGAPLFDPEHRVVGQLSGGAAACGNDSSDWYGRLASAWTLGLREFLDPVNSSIEVLDGHYGCEPPQVDFIVSPDAVDACVPRRFEALVEQGVEPLTFEWDADEDGAVDGRGHTYDHHYSAFFHGNAELRVTDATGCSARVRHQLTSGSHVVYTLSGERDYNWIDISEIGTPLTLTDDGAQEVSLPFAFFFYGRSFSSLSVGANGVLLLQGVDYSSPQHESIPTTSAAELIAPLWTDLNPQAGGLVHTHAVGEPGSRRFVVQWTDVPHFTADAFAEEAPDGVTFQVVLEEADQSILFQYQDVSFGDPELDDGLEATVGVQYSPSEALEFAYNTNALRSGLVLTFDATCADGSTDDAACYRCASRYCGDGTVNAGEQCDDGNTVGGDGCSVVCTIESCGNGLLDAGERCDDGNRADGDGCSAQCGTPAVYVPLVSKP